MKEMKTSEKTIKELKQILQQRGLLKEQTDIDTEQIETAIQYLTCDSRKVIPGTVFICKGAAFRSSYLQEAVQHGCIAYISECLYETEEDIPAILVTDIRKSMAVTSAYCFAYQPGLPKITGITGTKGKTTTAWYLKAMLDTWEQEKGRTETGLLSTIENYDGRERKESVMTTPEAPILHEFLAETIRNHVSYVTMEVSSQALKYKRVKELQFEVGVFLNISEDHISPVEHKDFEDYFSSKLSMFRQVQTVCINLDSEQIHRVRQAAYKAKRIITFGRCEGSDIRCMKDYMKDGKIYFEVVCDRFSETFELAMRGRFNIENAVAAIAAAYAYGVPVHCMKEALRKTVVPGRMETFLSQDQKICGIVDFAHNRLSFERLYDAAFTEYQEYTNIITVFGCPGGKALNRRKELGLIAGLCSDYVLITQDDPGMECPQHIAEEIKRYVEMTGCPCTSVEEREEAVCQAILSAARSKEKTLILLLGRGSEKYQHIGGKALKYPTDGELMKTYLHGKTQILS